MWFFFGIFTLAAATVWGLKTRLAARWQPVRERIGKLTFDYQEVRYKGSLQRVRIGVPAPAGLHFRVRTERLHDKFFKLLGVTCEIQTRHPEFDRKLYVESDARAVAIVLKRNAPLRAALIEIFVHAKTHRLRRMRLRCAHRRIWVEFLPKKEHSLFTAKQLIAPLLRSISTGLECIDLPTEYRRDRFVWRAAAVLAFSTATFALGIYGIFRSMGRTDILEPWLLLTACTIPALAILAGSLFFVLAWFIGSSRAHTVVLEFAIVGGLGFIMSTFALAREANIGFDSQPAARHLLTDISTEHKITRGRRGSKHHYYYLHCWDWREGHKGDPLRLEVSSSTFRQMEGIQSAAVYVKPGLLRFDWVERIEPVS